MTKTETEDKLPPPKPVLPLWSFAVHPQVAKAQPNWRANLISDFDITTHSVGTFDQFTGRCTKAVAIAVSESGRCSVTGARDDAAN